MQALGVMKQVPTSANCGGGTNRMLMVEELRISRLELLRR